MTLSLCIFFFNDTATTEIYTLSLHDALPISSTARKPKAPGIAKTSPTASGPHGSSGKHSPCRASAFLTTHGGRRRSARSDRKSTRLNSSHQIISYAVFCFQKKNILNHVYHHP